MTKYRNCPVTIDGEYYDSKREAVYHGDLKLLERAGKISGLRRQPQFPLEINGIKLGKYVADFEFLENGRRRVIDVKSPVTARHPVFKLKQKLVRALHGVDVEVVM